jgi:hypothetical protein
LGTDQVFDVVGEVFQSVNRLFLTLGMPFPSIDLRTDHSMGSEDQRGNLVLRLAFTPNQIFNKELNLQPFRSRFDPWPPPADIPAGVIPINPASFYGPLTGWTLKTIITK